MDMRYGVWDWVFFLVVHSIMAWFNYLCLYASYTYGNDRKVQWEREK